MTETQKNATYLFELPDRHYHSSESWWTTFFSMLLLYRTRKNSQWTLPTYTYCGGYSVESAPFEPGRLSLADLIVEAPLSKYPFRLESWPLEFLQLKPDVCILNAGMCQATFIEVKTIGASIAKNHDRYVKARNHLRTLGWSVDFYYLLSHGHEHDDDWPLIERDEVRVMHWEDVLRAAMDTPFGELFDHPLTEYATEPSKPPDPTLQQTESARGGEQ